MSGLGGRQVMQVDNFDDSRLSFGDSVGKLTWLAGNPPFPMHANTSTTVQMVDLPSLYLPEGTYFKHLQS